MKQPYGISSTAGDVLAEAGSWTLLRGAGCPDHPQTRALERILVKFFPTAVAELTAQMPLPVRAVMPLETVGLELLGGRLEAVAYVGGDRVLCYHGSRDESETVDRLTRGFNPFNVAVVDVGAVLNTLRDNAGADDAISIEAIWTMPYAMALVSDWLGATRGLSPLEVVNRGGIEAFRDVHAAARDRAIARGASAGRIGYEIAERFVQSGALPVAEWGDFHALFEEGRNDASAEVPS